MADNKNALLPEISNQWTNLGVAHILKHSSRASEMFANRKSNRLIHYGDRVAIRYNQWQEKLTQYKAPSTTDQLTHKDLGRGSSIEQFIPLTSFGCVSELIPEQIIKRAMSSEENTVEFLTDKIEQAASRGEWEIDKKFLADIVKDSNYSKKAIFKLPAENFVTGKDKDGMENVRKLVSKISTLCKAMCWPSKEYNQMGLMSTSYSLKRLIAIISFEVFGMLEDYYGHAFNMEHTELGRKFARVEVLPIYDKDRFSEGFNKHFIFMDEEGYVLDIDKDSETGFDESRKAFREKWFYKWLDGYCEVGLGYNMVCLAESISTTTSTSPKKTLLTDYADISDKSSKMTKDQAKEWEVGSFSFEQTKDWIAAGLECKDAKFASWLKSDKSYTEAKKLLDDSSANLETLRKEFEKK